MKTREEADRANEAKTNFLLRMSHDIRTPINGIRGLVQMSYYYENDPEKLQDCRRKVLGATDHLLSLINVLKKQEKYLNYSVFADFGYFSSGFGKKCIFFSPIMQL